jgi:hypothetical protein
MDFSEKLNLMMDLFSISNSKLSRQLSIDPSLVSKWRHGNRMPARNASYIAELVVYFYQLYQSSDAMIQHRLRRMLGESAELHLDDSEMILKQLLMEWLNPIEGDSKQNDRTISGHQSQQVIHMVQHLLNQENITSSQTEVLEAIPESPGGSRREYHLHAGRAGRRRAVLEFLDMVLEMKPPQELLLHSQEDLAWMSESREFLDEWNRKLMAVLMQGHQITIIHHMDRQEQDLFSIMKYWIPLHLTGNVRSWYSPVYKEMPFKTTHFIIRNQAAIYASVSQESDDENNYTFFYREPLVAQILENSYRVFLNQCVPLVNSYMADRMDAYMAQLTELEEEAGTWIGWKNGLSSSAISVSLYEQLLIQAGVGGAERWKRLQLQQRRLEAFRKNIAHFSFIEILPLTLLNHLNKDTRAALSPLEAFTPNRIILTNEQVVAVLESVVDRLQKYPNYEVYLANANPLWKEIDMSLGYKENRAAVAASLGPAQQRPAALVTGEGNVVLTFEGFFDAALESIPGSYKNRHRVMEKIQKIIRQMRQQSQSSLQQT